MTRLNTRLCWYRRGCSWTLCGRGIGIVAGGGRGIGAKWQCEWGEDTVYFLAYGMNVIWSVRAYICEFCHHARVLTSEKSKTHGHEVALLLTRGLVYASGK